MTVRWDKEAENDLNTITLHLLQTTHSREITAHTIGILSRDLKKLSETPFLDRKDPELGLNSKRRWYYLRGTDFKVYYLRLGPKTIKVVRIWPSKREPLQPNQIFKEELDPPPTIV
jgi:plasmid stabilization system protein ParE